MWNNLVFLCRTWLSGASFLSVLFAAFPAVTQIVPDNTLGNESSVVVPNQNIRGVNGDRIDGGAVRGSNLFHSFREFNVGEGRGAYFSNPDNIVNILSRVTGNNISQILGTLGVLGNANLFFINPNGIVFGPNARLDVGGSFFASTADGIWFKNGFEFATSNPEAPPLLTINIPIGLNFRENPGEIRVEGIGNNLSFDFETLAKIRDNRPAGLQVPDGRTLALIGGNISLEGGNLTAAEGRVELGSVAGSGTVTLAPQLNGPLIYDEFSTFGRIQLSWAASVDVSGNGGGDINVQAGRLELLDGSAMLSQTLGSESAGGIAVKASESVELIGTTAGGWFPSLMSASVAKGATGNAGNLTINTRHLSLSDGAQIAVDTFGNGDGGNLTVAATNVELVGQSVNGEFPSALGALVAPEATGNGGTININTQRLSVRDGALITASTFAQGNGGNLTIAATDIELVGVGQLPSAFRASVLPGATGNGGTLTVDTQNLSVRDGATIDVRSERTEAAGDLIVNAQSILLDNQASLNAETTAGRGNIIVNADDLRLRRNSNITTNATGVASGGNIILDTKILIAIENSDISANAQQAFGGQVFLSADAVFGTQFRQQQTSASDITATSELGSNFNGTVELNNEIDPAQGLVDLPQTVVEPAILIAQDPCKQGADSEFVITGRGGLPPSPQETVRSEETFVSLIELPPEVESRPNNSLSQKSRVESNTSTNSNQPVSSLDIVPARGWIRTTDGEVILVGYDPTNTGTIRQQPPVNQCNREPIE